MRMGRGYSLVELALSMVIAGIIASAAISTFSVVNRQIVQLRTEASVEAKLQRTLAALVADAQEVGGGAIRPWHALYVQPGDAASRGSDGMLALTADPQSPACPVQLFGEALNILTVPAPAGVCCLTPAAAVDPSEENEPAYVGRFAVLSKGPDSAVLGIARVLPAFGTCLVQVQKILTPERSAGFTDWNNSTLSVVDAKYVAVDHSDHTLNAYLLTVYEHIPDAEEGQVPDGTLTVGILESETRILARDIYDFQVASGYDLNLDGAVTESIGGAADEWLGNAVGEQGTETWIGDALAEGGGGGPSFLVSRFRMIEVGLVVGLKSKLERDRAGVSVLDSRTHDVDTLYLRAGRARAMFRNSGIYE